MEAIITALSSTCLIISVFGVGLVKTARYLTDVIQEENDIKYTKIMKKMDSSLSLGEIKDINEKL